MQAARKIEGLIENWLPTSLGVAVERKGHPIRLAIVPEDGLDTTSSGLTLTLASRV